MITVNSIICATLFLDETALNKVQPKFRTTRETTACTETQRTYGTTAPKDMAPAAQAVPPSVFDLLSYSRVRAVITVGFFLAFAVVTWEVVFVLFAYTPAYLGGLQRTTAQIGTLQSSANVGGMFIALVAFPALQPRFGTLPLLRACMALWIPAFAFFVPTGLLARQTLAWKGHSGDPRALGIIWAGIILILACGRSSAMAFSAYMIVVKSSAPSKEALGATFGLSQSVSCISRAIAPAFVSSLYAFSIDRQILGGNLVWLVMVVTALLGYFVTRRLQDCDAENGSKEPEVRT